jgi:hypothetical protein
MSKNIDPEKAVRVLDGFLAKLGIAAMFVMLALLLLMLFYAWKGQYNWSLFYFAMTAFLFWVSAPYLPGKLRKK